MSAAQEKAMDSIVVTIAKPISEPVLEPFIEDRGGRRVQGPRGTYWSVERVGGAAYLELQAELKPRPTPSNRCGAQRVIITVGRPERSLDLAFELARDLTEAWGGHVWCSNVPGWQDKYAAWLEAHRKT